MCTEMETLAEFLLPCCMAAGCSPGTKQNQHISQRSKSLVSCVHETRLSQFNIYRCIKVMQPRPPNNTSDGSLNFGGIQAKVIH